MLNVQLPDGTEKQFSDPITPLDRVYGQLLSHEKTAMAVTEGEQLLGVISMDSTNRYLMIQVALGRVAMT